MTKTVKLRQIAVPQNGDFGEWLFKSSDNRLFIMGNHKYACYCWMLAHENGIDLRNSNLIHVDAHFDYTIGDSNLLNVFIESPSSITALQECATLNDNNSCPHRIRNDDFIPAAVGVGLFQMAVFVCRKEQPHDLNKSINGRFLPYHIYYSLDEFKADYLKGKYNHSGFSLDIDLDYFNKDTTKNYDMNLDSKSIIFEQLKFLKKIPAVDVTTIALSEEFSGGKQAAPVLLGIVKEIWGISENIESAVQSTY